jgi:hypothetical protein
MIEEGEMRMPRFTAMALTYLAQFIVLGNPMPAFIERRWIEVGVLTNDGAPNPAMKKWGSALVTEEKSEGVLRMGLAILADVFEEGNPVIGVRSEDGITQ